MKTVFKVLIIVGAVITVPVVATYACFYDGTTKEVPTSQDFNINTFLPSKLAKSMATTKDNGKVHTSIDEADFDGILNTLIKSKLGDVSALKQAFIEIEGDNYIFNIAVEVPLFKTRAQIYTKLSTVKENGKDVYVFSINNIKLGRIPGLNGLAIGIAKNFVNDDVLSGALKDAGFHMSVSLDKGTITYNEEDLIKDLTDQLSGKVQGAETDLLFALLGDMLTNDYMTLTSNDALNIDIDLEPFSRNTTGMIDNSKAQTFDIKGCADKAKILIKADTIDESHLQSTFEYLIHGYEKSSDDYKSYVESKDFSAVGISNTKTYDGVVHKNSRPLIDIIGEQTVSISDLAMGGNITFMTETQANEYIAGSGMIGFSFLLHDDTYDNLSFITIDNFYGNLYRKNDVGHFSVVAGVNWNGYETSLIFDLTQAPTEENGYAITFNMDSIHFGEYATSGALSDYLFKLMGTSLEGDSTIKVNYNKKTITIDFTSSIDSATKAAVAMIGNPKMLVEGNDIADAGRVIAKIA